MNETRRDFLNDCAKRLAPASLEVMKRGMDALDRFFPGSCDDAADWSQENVDEYRNSLGATYEPATVALYGEFVLGHFLRFAGRSTLFARIEHVYRTRTHNNTRLGLPGEPIEAIIQLIPMNSATMLETA